MRSKIAAGALLIAADVIWKAVQPVAVSLETTLRELLVRFDGRAVRIGVAQADKSGKRNRFMTTVINRDQPSLKR